MEARNYDSPFQKSVRETAAKLQAECDALRADAACAPSDADAEKQQQEQQALEAKLAATRDPDRVFCVVTLHELHATAAACANPNLLGKPVAVTSQKGGRGVIREANAVARKIGLCAGMPNFFGFSLGTEFKTWIEYVEEDTLAAEARAERAKDVLREADPHLRGPPEEAVMDITSFVEHKLSSQQQKAQRVPNKKRRKSAAKRKGEQEQQQEEEGSTGEPPSRAQRFTCAHAVMRDMAQRISAATRIRISCAIAGSLSLAQAAASDLPPMDVRVVPYEEGAIQEQAQKVPVRMVRGIPYREVIKLKRGLGVATTGDARAAFSVCTRVVGSDTAERLLKVCILASDAAPVVVDLDDGDRNAAAPAAAAAAPAAAPAAAAPPAAAVKKETEPTKPRSEVGTRRSKRQRVKLEKA